MGQHWFFFLSARMEPRSQMWRQVIYYWASSLALMCHFGFIYSSLSALYCLWALFFFLLWFWQLHAMHSSLQYHTGSFYWPLNAFWVPEGVAQWLRMPVFPARPVGSILTTTEDDPDLCRNKAFWMILQSNECEM